MVKSSMNRIVRNDVADGAVGSEGVPGWALDWRGKSFAGRVGSNREPEATARSECRRDDASPGAVRPCGEEARGEPRHRTQVKP